MLKVYKRRIEHSSVFCLSGRLVTGEFAALHEAVLSEANASAIVLDFLRVSRIDAAGLGELLKLRQHAILKGIDFKLVNVSRVVMKILEISRLDTVFEILTERDLAKSTPQGHLTSMTAVCCA